MKKLLVALLALPLMAFGEVGNVELTKDNTVSLRDVVTGSSIAQLQFDILQLSRQLDDDEVIYLVLNTPGGSVTAGEAFIETLKSIPQPVHSVVLFAASMGFQITQATDTRLIANNGILMSHRAKLGINGQMDGELESRLALYKGIVGGMEERSAKRVGISLSDYKSIIVNEWWTYGNGAVLEKTADQVVNISCSEGLSKQLVNRTVRGFFGSVELTFSGCPLIIAPLNLSKKTTYGENQKYFDMLYTDKTQFVNTYITTGKLRF